MDPFAAKTRAFYAAKGHGVDAVIGAVVDHDAAAMQAVRGVEGSVEVVGEDAGLQPVFHVVGAVDGFVQLVKAVEDGDGAVYLLSG